MKYRCPACSKVLGSFNALRWHYKSKHCRQGICPVCGRQVRKLLAHLYNLARAGDAEHMLALALARSSASAGRSRSELLRRAVKRAIEVCRV